MRTQENASPESQARLLARLVRTLLAGEHFETLADLTDALKCECARLRIRRWTNDDINDAYRLIESNRPLPGTPPPGANPQHLEQPETVVPLSGAEATDILRRLRRVGLGITPVQTMTPVRQLSNEEIAARQRRADQAKAYRMVQQQILETAERAAALEAAIEPVDAGRDGIS